MSATPFFFPAPTKANIFRRIGASAKEYVSGNKMITFSARLLKVVQKGAAMESRGASRKCNVLNMWKL